MHDDETDGPEPTDEELERVRALIMQRRNRFIAAAMASIGVASQGAACGASVCLTLAAQAPGGAGNGTRPTVGGAAAPAAGSGGSSAAAGDGVITIIVSAGSGAAMAAAGSGGTCAEGPWAGTGGQGPSAGSAGSAGTGGNTQIEPCRNNPPPRVCLSAYAPPEELVDAGARDKS